MIYKSLLVAGAITAAFAAAPPTAHAAPDEYLGEIMTVGFNFCPRGTLEADGRLLPINQFSALFSLLGTTYGGDGRTTFALPDLRGRTMVGSGTGAGLSDRRMGERGGTESHQGGPAATATDHANAQGSTSAGNTMQPYLVVKHCVVTHGVFPSRS